MDCTSWRIRFCVPVIGSTKRFIPLMYQNSCSLLTTRTRRNKCYGWSTWFWRCWLSIYLARLWSPSLRISLICAMYLIKFCSWQWYKTHLFLLRFSELGETQIFKDWWVNSELFQKWVEIDRVSTLWELKLIVNSFQFQLITKWVDEGGVIRSWELIYSLNKLTTRWVFPSHRGVDLSCKWVEL